MGTQSERFRMVTLTKCDLDALTILDVRSIYNGDGRLLWLGLQAYSLGIAYEFEPYFGLSISRVDPLPHSLRLSTTIFSSSSGSVFSWPTVSGRERRLWPDEKIFTKRIPQTVEFQMDGAEFDLYGDVTRLVKQQSARAAVQAGAANPELQEAIRDLGRFPWHEATRVAHYWSEGDAMTRPPMTVREVEPPYPQGGA